jgi:hypothetical protein
LVSIDDIPDSVGQLADIRGMASDVLPGQIEKVQVVIGRKSDGAYWDGAAWGDSERWLDAIESARWSYSMPPLTDGQSYMIRAISVDTAGNLSVEASESFAVANTDPADPEPPATPGLPDPDVEPSSQSFSAPWWWFMVLGLGISALVAFVLVWKVRKDRALR